MKEATHCRNEVEKVPARGKRHPDYQQHLADQAVRF